MSRPNAKVRLALSLTQALFSWQIFLENSTVVLLLLFGN